MSTAGSIRPHAPLEENPEVQPLTRAGPGEKEQNGSAGHLQTQGPQQRFRAQFVRIVAAGERMMKTHHLQIRVQLTFFSVSMQLTGGHRRILP